jgi:hypothetical protein
MLEISENHPGPLVRTKHKESIMFIKHDLNVIPLDTVNEEVISEMDVLVTESGVESIDAFYPDAAGAMEIVVEMECDWNNLNAEMMTVQHQSIVNEDVMIFEGALKTFWENIKKFFVNIWNAIKSFTARVVDYLTSMLSNAEKWYAKHGKDISVDTVKMETYPGVANDNGYASKLQAQYTELLAKANTGKLEEVKAAASSEILSDSMKLAAMAGFDKKGEETVSKARVEKILKGSNSNIVQLKERAAKGAMAAKSAIKIATAQASSTAKDEDGQKVAKDSVEALKTFLVVGKRIDSSLIRFATIEISEAAKAARLMLGASKKVVAAVA